MPHSDALKAGLQPTQIIRQHRETGDMPVALDRRSGGLDRDALDHATSRLVERYAVADTFQRRIVGQGCA
ncbi:MAG: hypothetical protein Q8Q88_09670 [Phenylobacterium sp.]|uniref:hypothetical protein n=1 Tax=Phenylobacterium sp. TaxID=1871053 RepID=UPI0027338321|nr:hypothetical protein [Phenylobacterium sp.]MDP3747301.1 hypothetical protein [Phenylobacterium sp.]